MKRKYKYYLTVLISLLIPFTASACNSKNLQVNSEPPKGINKFDKARINNLEKDSNWNSVRNYWVSLNHIGPRKNFESLIKYFDDLRKQLPDINNNLAVLVHDHLISQEEKDFIYSMIESRLFHLEGTFGAFTCYEPTIDGGQVMELRTNLEEQYDLLENLFKENKINQQTFSTIQQKLLKDINQIQAKENDTNKANDNLTELIMYLNKQE